VGAARIDDESFDALLSVMRKPVEKGNKGPHIPSVGPRRTAALGLAARASGQWATMDTSGSDTLARQPGYIPSRIEVTADTTQTGREVPPLLLPIPADHAANRRDDGHGDFEQLRSKGLIRDRDGEVIELKSLWHAWGAWRIDRFFQAYCRRAADAAARGEKFPSDAVRRWVEDEAATQGMSIEFAHRVIRDGCGGVSGKNAMWWRGSSVSPGPG